ncbi:MAG: M50 family metallopeptidase [Atopobiaceae bacterium]|jgi:regulator of sigma E protease|nr:M50 family metallopeptidase [Atopobiaceae bacterium]MCI2173184.1 M50 family metallopeptidase [Atopobiaceae bacterium]MCI2208277.1 M50 family metallopeptidase [Atopobiaceae bacterium]
MTVVSSALSAIFWGLIILSLLVFVHEGGHFLVARAFGMRVTEFFLGMPCRFKLSRRSERYGTEYGVTPILLGGYNRICGMEGDEGARMGDVLLCVMRRGRASVSEVAAELGMEEEDVLSCLVTLSDWASVEPYYDPEKGEKPGQRYYPESFQTVRRDGSLLTAYDRDHDFDDGHTTDVAEPREASVGADELIAAERSHTYQGAGFWKRFLMLVAGAFVNIACGFILVVGVLMISGVSVNSGTNSISSVVDGSVAANAGLQGGDTITVVDGTEVADWQSLVDALDGPLASGTDFQITFVRDGRDITTTVELGGNVPDQFGIYAQTERVHLGLVSAVSYTSSYIGTVCSYVVQLLMPEHTQEILDSSTSIVGISVMASQAAAAGLDELCLFTAAISLSLGFMNLLPIPPLDGGKMLIEVIQAVTRRKIPARVQNIISYIGLALFMLLFVYMLRQDVFRFILG